MPCIFCQSTRHDYRSCTVARNAIAKPFSQDFVGKSPNVFIGKYGYPHVRVGILGTEQYDGHDDPLGWSERNTPIPQIIQKRAELVNAYTQAQVKAAAGKLVKLSADISLAKRPVDVEVNLAKKPALRMSFGRDTTPHGPNVALKDAHVTQNVPIEQHIESATRATDLTASEAIAKLEKHADPYYLTKAFSTGSFGLPTERKIVPTRWSITAVDDIRGKRALEHVRQLPVGDCQAYFGGHYGNYYLVLCFDDVLRYELFEQHLSSKQLWTDYEGHEGRSSYASSTVGGYYAARVGILEECTRRKRQWSVLAIRIITDEYTNPLGVWVVREATKKAMASRPITFSDRALLVEYAKEFLQRKFGYDVGPLLKQSQLMRELFGQKRLTSY